MAKSQRAWIATLLLLAIPHAVAKDCFDYGDADSCLAHKESGITTCEWCASGATCHAVGSIVTPCAGTCCVSKSLFSMCKHSKLDTIPKVCDAFTPATVEYSHETALRLVHIAGASYCEPTEILDWTCTHCNKISNFTTLAVAEDPARELQAIVGMDWSGPSPVRVVAFRGTVQKKPMDWVNDGEVWKTSPYEDLPDVKVHSGFYHSYYDVLKQQVVAALQAHHPEAPVLVTGHSLGGAMAVVCAFDLARSGFNVAQVFTFGQPRVGNRYFASAYKLSVPNHWRVTHHNDIIPHLPVTGEGFDHSPTEVYYPNDDPNEFHICNGKGEDKECSNRCSYSMECRSVHDHLVYLGIDIGTQTCTRPEEESNASGVSGSASHERVPGSEEGKSADESKQNIHISLTSE
eukprot:CAMPEP_0197849626 /NCGR_PEP_ID=MMETSP1438-20131217/12738_1 /TAXON_ID=1461541 /ORGANISM="Pterosperma sp., Strain CCMP1384" /LENGTH=403 /DNA_ID=CAMNT_0043462403 /DNA_START=122 /DNA_END=1333 /DNA_ORIENTATION=+